MSESDSAGIPWNANFHREDQKTNKDGTWRMKNGADRDALNLYEAGFLSVEQAGAPKRLTGYHNPGNGAVEIYNWHIGAGETSECPADIKKSNRFKMAVKLGMLVKK